jgi:hypothetical protein
MRLRRALIHLVEGLQDIVAAFVVETESFRWLDTALGAA